MALFAIDPRPFVPLGFEWQPRIAPREPRRMRVFLGPSGVKENENLAIAITEPKVNPVDFHVMANSLQEFLQQEHQVRDLEIWRCPIGEAYVRFSCPLERTRFLRQPLQFGQYQIRFIKHDVGCNARMTDMDREAWLMLLAYPTDYRSDLEIDKALAGFAILKHVHRSSNVARLIVKVMINKEDDVPDEIVVSPGDSPRAHSWTVPVYILFATDLAMLADEDALPPDGCLHPLPHPAPHWMEHQAPAGQAQEHIVEEDSVGNIPGDNSAAEDLNQAVPMEEDHQAQNLNGNVQRDQVGPDATVEYSPLSGAAADFAASGGMKAPVVPPPVVPLKVVFQRLLQSLIPSHPLPSFRNISRISINLDTMIPAYLFDPDLLWHLAKVVDDEPRVIETLSEVEVLDKMPARKAPKKRRARKPRGLLEVGALRRSNRLKKVYGFKDDASASAAAAKGDAGIIASEPETEPAVAASVLDGEASLDPELAVPVPLEVVPVVEAAADDHAAIVPYQARSDPSAPVAPYLPSSLLKAIGTEFLKMPPGGASDVQMASSSDVE
ncbi:unnamed protein product [Urochloa humidicola]